MSRALAEAFERQVDRLLKAYPQLPHQWTNDHDGRTLVFPPQSANGFEVWVVVNDDNLIIGAGHAHEHFEFDDRPPDTIAASAVGLVRDLLSPGMRLVERSANGKPYHWKLESKRDGQWVHESTTATWIFNWFGPRSERVLQNATLDARPLSSARE